MNLQNLVPSLETCKKLKEAGFRQNTLFKYCNYNNDVVILNVGDDFPNICAAPTLGEIKIPAKHVIEKYAEGEFYISKRESIDLNIYDFFVTYRHFKTEIEALAALWLYLYEQPRN